MGAAALTDRCHQRARCLQIGGVHIWVALAITIVAGLLALRSEYTTPLAAVKRIRAMRASIGDAAAATKLTRNLGTLPNPTHKWSVHIMVATFLIALASICAFAVVNLPFQ